MPTVSLRCMHASDTISCYWFYLIIAPDPFEPPDLFDDGEDVVQVKIGMTEVLCLSGRSPGSNGDTYWTKGETVIPSLNISDSLNCSKSFDCSDCIEELLSVPVVTQTESHYASFHVTYSSYSDDLVNECSEPNRFVSFLVISQVAPEDAGEYGFVFTSLRNRFTETHKEVNTGKCWSVMYNVMLDCVCAVY